MGVSKFSPASQRGVDTTPTASSTNLVESGGVKSALTHDLANIIATGSTNATGATITAGTFFYLNGILVQAKVDIASGATFTNGTNYESVTAGGLNALKSAINAWGVLTANNGEWYRGTSFNNFNRTGVYWVGDGLTDGPVTSAWGALIVLTRSKTGGDTYFQILIMNEHVYTRSYANSGWNSWLQLK